MGFPLTKEEHDYIERLIQDQEEIIVAAAVRADGIIFMVERPGRHGECINFLSPRGLDYMDQGFVTNKGRFVDRQEAGRIAVKSGQGSTMGERVNFNLFSEDLWAEH